jgi:exopolyphosphatase/guanosine-5'-triphosphate,3'-diphosphate pyrophosphatase
VAKITAVIDVGSNSARMAVFERTSRYGFHLLNEVKSRVRISENAYKNGGVLQEAAIRRAEDALEEFMRIANSYGARKILAVATSAVRDAPNKNEFLSRVFKRCSIRIRIIAGKEEARFGGLAAANLLAIKNGVTIDIGGGSTELALIKEGRIAQTISFNLGTVRLKELFFDEKSDIKGAIRFAETTIASLPSEFNSDLIVGVGGTMRALSNAIIKADDYPFEALHGFCFSLGNRSDFFDRIIKSDFGGLKDLGFKQDRFDVIREGTLIFKLLAKNIGAKEAITSGVGVREGVFLTDLLRSSGTRLPNKTRPSLISLIDRFGVNGMEESWRARNAALLFDLLKPLHRIDDRRKEPLCDAARLLSIGEYIDPYHPFEQGAQVVLNGLSYGFNHNERALISELIRMQQKKTPALPENPLGPLLPKADTLRFLAAILLLIRTLNRARERARLAFALEGNTLMVKGAGYLAREGVAKLKLPFDLRLI